MIQIKERIDDALFLWKNDKKESAFLLCVISLAALSKNRYPNDRDGEAFRKTFQDFRKFDLKIEFRGELVSLDQIFYKWIRCNLVHEAELPFDIEFIENTDLNMSIRAGGHPEYVLKIGTGWFFYLTDSILHADELY